MFKSYNKNRPEYLGEIQILDLQLNTDFLDLRNFRLFSTSDRFQALFQYDINWKGCIEIELEFEIYLNWPKEKTAKVLCHTKINIKSLFGNLRSFYKPIDQGKGFYSFAHEPRIQIDLDPIIGKQNQVQLIKIPHVEKTLKNVIKKKVRKFVWPNKKSLSIPLNRNSKFIS